MSKYNKDTVFNEFRHLYSHDGSNNDFIEFLNTTYDRVKSASIESIMKSLPIEYHGFGGTYHEDWMVHEVEPTKHYPFRYRGYIYDWYGDRSTTEIVTAVANNKDDLYRRMLVQYMWYLSSDLKYPEVQSQMDQIIRNISNECSIYRHRRSSYFRT